MYRHLQRCSHPVNVTLQIAANTCNTRVRFTVSTTTHVVWCDSDWLVSSSCIKRQRKDIGRNRSYNRSQHTILQSGIGKTQYSVLVFGRLSI